MKVVHKLVVTHAPDEMVERVEQALQRLGCPEPQRDGQRFLGTAVIGREKVELEVSWEPTAHGHELTVRAVDRDSRAQPARRIIKQFGDRYWRLEEEPRRPSRSSRRRRARTRWREHSLALACGILAFGGLVIYLIWFR